MASQTQLPTLLMSSSFKIKSKL